jgi:hypothetical protein
MRWIVERTARHRRGAALLGLLALTSCGNLTSGGVTEVELYGVADEPEPTGAAAAAWGPAAQPSQVTRIEGTLTMRVRTFLQSTGGDWVELTDGPTEVTLDLDGSDETRLARRPVSAGRYRRVRSVFGRIEAEVVRGLIVDGEPVVGRVQVQLGQDGFLTTEEALDLEAPDGGQVSLLLDLNAQLWLRVVDRVQRRVAMRDFQDVVRTRVRGGS